MTTPALLIFKPDAAHRVAARTAIWEFVQQRDDVTLRGLKWFQPPSSLIESHYDFLQGRPFFPWLVEFMSSLPVIVGLIEADEAGIEKFRYDLGETRIQAARPGSIRERFGIYGGINCLHLSDSAESGRRETESWGRHIDLNGVEAPVNDGRDRPDHTFHLRSLAAQVATGTHAEVATARMQELLAEESDLDGEQLQKLSRIVIDGIS